MGSKVRISNRKPTWTSFHLAVANGVKQKSEKNISWPAIRNGIMDGSKMGRTERHENALALAIAIKIAVIKKAFKSLHFNNLYQSNMIKTALLLLSCKKCPHSKKTYVQVKGSEIQWNHRSRWCWSVFQGKMWKG